MHRRAEHRRNPAFDESPAKAPFGLADRRSHFAATRVTFTVPVAAEAPRATSGGARPARDDVEAAHILVVDDDPQTLRYVRTTLTKAGYKSLVTGEHLVLAHIIRTEKPALVLLDLILPGTDDIHLMDAVAVAGSEPVDDANLISTALDNVRSKYPDMVLVHGGGPGAEKTASRRAESRGVHQVVCKPDWNAHGRAAPFRRNDQLLSLLPKGVVGFLGSIAGHDPFPSYSIGWSIPPGAFLEPHHVQARQAARVPHLRPRR